MTGLEAAVIVAVGVATAAAVRRRDGASIRASRSGGRTGRMPKRSRLVVMYNNTGAKPVESDDAGSAAAELFGRVLGGTARRGHRTGGRARKAVVKACKRTGKSWHQRSGERWEQRRSARPAETFVDKWKRLHASRPRLKERRRASGVLRRLARLLGVVDSPADTAAPRDAPPEPRPDPAPPPPDAPRSAPVPKPSPVEPLGDPKMTAPTMPTSPAEAGAAPAAVAAPTDWAALIARVSDFTPENDVDLIEWMKGEAAGVVAYAEGLESARENCVTAVGLDPSAVAGITTYSEHMSDASARMTEALATFLVVYGEVLKLAGDGVVLPFNGRWITGAAS